MGVCLWLGVGLSLGWYYTFTYYGKTGVPMPTIEPCLALVMYYFSVLNVITEVQAVHWMAVFPAAGAMWAYTLTRTAPLFDICRRTFPDAFLLLALAALPLALPAPWMSWVAGVAPGESFSVERMLLVALRRDGQTPWPTLTPMYLGLGLFSLGLQIAAYARLFRAPFRVALKHYCGAAVVASAAAAIFGAVVAIPLRLVLE